MDRVIMQKTHENKELKKVVETWAEELNISVEKLVLSLGFKPSTLLETSKEGLEHNSHDIKRIKRLLKKLENRFENKHQIWEWFTSEKIPALGEITPSDVIKKFNGKGIDTLLEYIEHKELGGFE